MILNDIFYYAVVLVIVSAVAVPVAFTSPGVVKSCANPNKANPNNILPNNPEYKSSAITVVETLVMDSCVVGNF